MSEPASALASSAATPSSAAPPSGAPTALQLRGASGGALVLPLPAMQRFDALRLAIRELFGFPPGRYRGARVRLDLANRELDLMEIRRIIHMCKDEFEVEIIGLICENATIQRMAERELKLKINTNAPVVTESALVVPSAPGDGPTLIPESAEEAATSLYEHDPSAYACKAVALVDPTGVGTEAGTGGMSGMTTAFQTEQSGTEIVAPPGEESDEHDADLGDRVLTVRNTLRSGACVRFGGDVHVWGDVNPGAQIIAGGSIVVFGALKGMAHAGTRDDDAMILAFDLRPTQVRIGRVIGVVPGANPDQPTRGFHPEIACVLDGQLVVDQWRGRLPSHLISKQSQESA